MPDGDQDSTLVKRDSQPYTLHFETENILCNLNPEPISGCETTLCIIPTQAKDIVATLHH